MYYYRDRVLEVIQWYPVQSVKGLEVYNGLGFYRTPRGVYHVLPGEYLEITPDGPRHLRPEVFNLLEVHPWEKLKKLKVFSKWGPRDGIQFKLQKVLAKILGL